MPRSAHLSTDDKADDKARTEALAKGSVAQWKFKADVRGAKVKAKAELDSQLAALGKTMEDELAAKRLKYAEFSEGESGIT